MKDLLCRFFIAQTGFVAGDGLGVLKGRLLDGTRIGGADTVVIRP